MDRNGICKLCRKYEELQLSHAIPNTYFRHILSRSGGTAIGIIDDQDTDISNTTDSAKELQLCRGCELKIEHQYEGASSNLFKGKQGVEITTQKNGVSYAPINNNILTMFFVSIIWRAANSNQKLYSKISLCDELNEQLRKAILWNNFLGSKMIGIRCLRLVDDTKDGGFTQDNLSELITAPFIRTSGRHKSFYLIFFGIFTEIRIGGFRHKERGMKGVLRSSSKMLFMPYINIFDIPELNKTLISGYRKHKEGKSKINRTAPD